jgi:hypothetical protein
LARPSGIGGKLVVLLRNFSEEIVPHTRVGGVLIEMAPDEPFETFEGRAVAAAKAAGINFVAINVPDLLPIGEGVSAPISP